MDCPCGSGAAYDDCCGPIVRNERWADTPEELMRSRYTAYSFGGGPADDDGVVEFRATHAGGELHERSRFVRRAGRWVYLDGTVRPR